MSMNAAATLLAAGAPHQVALVCDGEDVTYDALRERTARAASAWRRRGLLPGERVAIKLPDGCAWVSGFLGTIWAGGVAVAVNPRIPSEDWQFILSESPFRFVLAESREDMPQAWRERTITLDEWRDEAAAAPPLAAQQADPDAPAFWTHSSGTSGRPKAVVQAHRFALSVEAVAEELLGVRPEDRLFASSKLFFSYPLGNSLFPGLKLGATLILDPQWPTAAGVAATVAAQRPTVFFSVPSLYRNLIKEGFAPRFADRGIRVCVSAGEALPTSLRDEWRRQTGMSIVNGFGASETLGLVLVNRDDGEDLSPTPGVEIEALDPGCGDTATRIRIRAPTLAIGYWHRPDADAENFREGAFCPADLFRHTGTGAWRFAGREDSLVKVRGRWINLVELEERLQVACPCLAEAAAAAVPDDDGVAEIAFFYVFKSDAQADADLALRAFAQSLPHYQRPRWLCPVAALPRTATGKLMRRKLVELHRTDAATDTGVEPKPGMVVG